MQSINRLTLLGNVGKVTELDKLLKVSVATERNWTDEKGKRQKRTDWVTVTILNGKRADWIRNNVNVGDSVYVEGRVGNSSYEKDGKTVYTTDVIAAIFTRVHPRSEAKENSDDSEE
ncbi:MAG: single-stranded DNA-binding protein [Mesorhizobium sp.]|uniref:single-stranded DNA-binding protein n=1 Tax=Mesorhizobium sp. TaxID=1871066 RepID=UPI000FE728ED|nr:single-stranded DNA-binding protein [Mesorhizobium sp.]RWO03393.1 MAG: single-stranded DNA-binding protein [Mesorhizobium sp.]RWO03880.1 MAG: single-stranded DNA-binding protein [Mesorhizobium sp.]RWO93771.1 MAG: single-stranded DNA-binding protein [Mesorhizobium sp.]TIU17816.1 MAG: single-stranded DNA-binding protein [Mesorhizobium sp.]